MYRNVISELTYVRVFIQNLSIDFEEAIKKARGFSGDDEHTDTYDKILLSDPDEVTKIVRLGTSKAQAELEGTLVFGKYRTHTLQHAFESDKKYVEWIAKGGFIKTPEGYWNETISEERPIRQQAIGLLIGAGDWVERNGKFMPVQRAQKLDYLESLTLDPSIKDKQRVERNLRLLGKVYYNDGCYGTTASFKMIDENEHIYHAHNVSRYPFEEQDENTWFKAKFTASIYNEKLYMKRMLPTVFPVSIEGNLDGVGGYRK